MLPEFNSRGDLPAGVHSTNWSEFRSSFKGASLRRTWLLGRLRVLLQLAAETGQLHRVFIWGSFVTMQANPRNLDVLLIMSEDFEVARLSGPAQAVFDSSRARQQFTADVFWERASIRQKFLEAWLETYQSSGTFEKRGIVELAFS